MGKVGVQPTASRERLLTGGRNAGRFPGDFMFQLAAEESGSLRSQFGALKTGRGKHRKYAPYVFTEQEYHAPIAPHLVGT